MIAKGERPSYRLVIAPSSVDSVAWSLIGLPGIVAIAQGSRALDAARATIAAVLDVPADAFDLRIVIAGPVSALSWPCKVVTGGVHVSRPVASHTLASMTRREPTIASDSLARAIESLRQATNARERAVPGSVTYEEAIVVEELLNALVLDLVRRRNRTALWPSAGRRPGLAPGSVTSLKES